MCFSKEGSALLSSTYMHIVLFFLSEHQRLQSSSSSTWSLSTNGEVSYHLPSTGWLYKEVWDIHVHIHAACDDMDVPQIHKRTVLKKPYSFS